MYVCTRACVCACDLRKDDVSTLCLCVCARVHVRKRMFVSEKFVWEEKSKKSKSIKCVSVCVS